MVRGSEVPDPRIGIAECVRFSHGKISEGQWRKDAESKAVDAIRGPRNEWLFLFSSVLKRIQKYEDGLNAAARERRRKLDEQEERRK